jgi:hypothetical protein
MRFSIRRSTHSLLAFRREHVNMGGVRELLGGNGLQRAETLQA